jgi:hypothetical protein
MPLTTTEQNYKSSSFAVAQSSEQAPFTSEIVCSILTWSNDTRVKRVSQRSTESRGFSPGTTVSSHNESWQGGLGLAP